jgi:hypothetical protein
MLATSWDIIHLQKRGFELRLMTWRASSISPWVLVREFGLERLRSGSGVVDVVGW